jgi:hypothetical protein
LSEVPCETVMTSTDIASAIFMGRHIFQRFGGALPPVALRAFIHAAARAYPAKRATCPRQGPGNGVRMKRRWGVARRRIRPRRVNLDVSDEKEHRVHRRLTLNSLQ